VYFVMVFPAETLVYKSHSKRRSPAPAWGL